jgi:uncharacterized protein YyaL (SSP411 family)
MTNNISAPNRLIHEKSPYLLQHAHNPVDWYPWGDEAFAKAQAEDKPIFLSIGYSTCHWCHVMEWESFEDEEVADVLNAGFISIKVDREERPDLDHLYMTFCQALTGHGGWPMTMIMNAEKKPFFAGTYFPKQGRMGMPGLLEILKKIEDYWQHDREKLSETAEELTAFVLRVYAEDKSGSLTPAIPERAYEELATYFDPVYGGFGQAPKFPSTHNLLFLLSYYRYKIDPQALAMVEKTLVQMYKGGIFDHLGFGFARYSTDQKWLVPHFEKMLYDNALLAIAYLDAFQITGKTLYRDVAQKIFSYVSMRMTSAEGAFFSAEDADSEGVEGKYYLWTPAEVEKILGKEAGTAFCRYYDITEKGNFAGNNIPNLIGRDIEKLGQNADDAGISLEEDCHKLLAARERRIPPFRDDKILTGWNALMIAALAIGGRVLEEQATEYLGAAEKAFAFLRQKLVNGDGRLLARYRDGEAAYPAYLDDYAFLVWALLELYESTGHEEYLAEAVSWNERMLTLFGVEEEEGKTLHLYFNGQDSEILIVRPREIYDGALPAGNSVAAWNLLRLAEITGSQNLRQKAERLFFTVGGEIGANPMGYTFMLYAYLWKLGR